MVLIKLIVFTQFYTVIVVEFSTSFYELYSFIKNKFTANIYYCIKFKYFYLNWVFIIMLLSKAIRKINEHLKIMYFLYNKLIV